jgi:hypothetical protein
MKFSFDRKGDKERQKKRDDILSRLDKGRRRHDTWVSQQFANRKDVLRDATEEVDAFEEEMGLRPGTIQAVFDDTGAHLGYFLVVTGHRQNLQELIDRIRTKTGEWFEVDHIV